MWMPFPFTYFVRISTYRYTECVIGVCILYWFAARTLRRWQPLWVSIASTLNVDDKIHLIWQSGVIWGKCGEKFPQLLGTLQIHSAITWLIARVHSCLWAIRYPLMSDFFKDRLKTSAKNQSRESNEKDPDTHAWLTEAFLDLPLTSLDSPALRRGQESAGLVY